MRNPDKALLEANQRANQFGDRLPSDALVGQPVGFSAQGATILGLMQPNSCLFSEPGQRTPMFLAPRRHSG